MPDTTTVDKRQQLLQRLLREQGLAPGEPAPLRIPRRPAEQDRVPQSFAQRRLWFLDQLAPGNPFYTVSLVVPVAGAIDAPALQRALDDLVRRHEALRTTFRGEGGEALQCVGAPRPALLERVDLSGLPPDARGAEADRLAAAETQRAFDLGAGPLMVALLVTLGPREHRLLLTLHHIVCDGWSLRVLSAELLELYGAHATGRAPALPELPVQYADFALWQRERMTGVEGERQLAYWRGVLAGAPELRLPPDRARPAVPTFRGGFVPVVLGAAEAAALARVCGTTGATPFVVLMAAWMVLLGRLSGQQDFVVGTPIAGRTRPELEPLIGFFVNTLVLRADLSGEPTFHTLVERVRTRALDAFANQDLPFERLVEELAPERVLGRNPLFQAIFQLFSAQDGVRGNAAPDARQRGTAKFDLRLDLWATADGYAGELEYAEDVFERASAVLIAGQYQALVAALLAAPDRPVADADILGPAQYRELVDTVNATAAPYPDDRGVADLFRAAAAKWAAMPALRFADGMLSYGELDAASDALACRLAERGVRHGHVVGVLAHRSAAMVTAWLAALKLGAAYLPLDPELPALRLDAMLEDAGVRVVAVAPALAPLLAGLGVAQERLDDTRAAPPVAWPRIGGADLAQVIFTSGSSGRPKGVRIAQRGIARLTCNIDWAAFHPGERVAHAANPAFDASTYEVWSALLNGCTLVEVDRDTALSAAALERRLAEERIDHLFLTTALFVRHAAERPGMFAGLRSLVTGGAAADVQAFRAVLAAGAPPCLLHAYGPTETTVLASVWRVRDLPPHAAGVPIGRPITNTTCYVLDGACRPVPPLVPGQLYVGGPGVALGYCGNADLAARRFVPDPWGGGTLYATGDKVRWRHDGLLEFLGRYDDQLKLRGFRVEPDEIAAVLAGHPAVRGAVVVARDRGGHGADADDQRLVAYVEPDGGGVDPAALVAHWRDLYDTVLYDAPAADAAFNTSGWNDTATGQPLARDDMEGQVAQTVARVLAGAPQAVLEVGCGTGLLLLRIAPHCARYVGTDLSEAALANVRAALPPMDHVTLVRGGADDLSGVPPGLFDVVLLNSVVQYFPSFDYLVEAVRQAAARLRPGGTLYLGDLRHKDLLPAFRAAVLLAGAPEDAEARLLRDRLRRAVDEEQELALAPAALALLCRRVPGFAPARIELKRGRGPNELNRYRYDALLTWQGPEVAPPQVATCAWTALGADLAALRAAVLAAGDAGLRVTGLPNARTFGAVRVAEDIAAMRGDVAAWRDALAQASGCEPEDVWALGDELGRDVQVTWNERDPALFDALFLPPGAPLPPLPEPAAEPAAEAPYTEPLRGHFLRTLVPALKAHAAARLPAYMLPEHYQLLDRLPLTPNGKVDKAALPEPVLQAAVPDRAGAAGMTATERTVAALWARLLNVPEPGPRAHFFNDLGGHSLLATQVMARLRTDCGVELPLRTIFEGPTVTELARAVDAARGAGQATAASEPALALDDLDALDIDALDEAALDAALARLAGEAR